MRRSLSQYVKKDLTRKIIIISGPRQVGKTTLARDLQKDHTYLNFDVEEHRNSILTKSWNRSTDLVVFDEIHKMKNWKAWLKGIYDGEGLSQKIVVTGSAKLDTYRKVGDSLAGRYFLFHLLPLTPRELARTAPELTPSEAFSRLLETSSFPEPFLENNQEFYNRWKTTHLDIILRQDLIDLERVQDIKAIETLIFLLTRQIGSLISYSSLAQTLQVNDKTVKRWLGILEDMFVIFRVNPYHRKVSRSILKAPKYYFYDTGRVVGDSGQKLENLVALSLYREIKWAKDCHGKSVELCFVRKKDGREVDFLIVENEIPRILIECKLAEANPSSSLEVIGKEMKIENKIQLVGKELEERHFPSGIKIKYAPYFLSNFKI